MSVLNWKFISSSCISSKWVKITEICAFTEACFENRIRKCMSTTRCICMPLFQKHLLPALEKVLSEHSYTSITWWPSWSLRECMDGRLLFRMQVLSANVLYSTTYCVFSNNLQYLVHLILPMDSEIVGTWSLFKSHVGHSKRPIRSVDYCFLLCLLLI